MLLPVGIPTTALGPGFRVLPSALEALFRVGVLLGLVASEDEVDAGHDALELGGRDAADSFIQHGSVDCHDL